MRGPHIFMLRDYQQDALNQIRALYAKGIKKVMLHLATGAGKTVIFSHCLKESAARGIPAIMVVRGRDLVRNASDRLTRERVPHSVKMSGSDSSAGIISVCSIDTLISRQEFPEAKLVVIDEADQATSEGYHALAKAYPNAYFLSVTATPYTKKSLKHVAQAVVRPISIQELVNQGHLVAPRYFAPSTPNLQGVKIVNNEYKNSEIEERMGPLTGDIVSTWERLGRRRPTICFAVNRRHSHEISNAFIHRGILCGQADANTKDDERNQILSRLEKGQTKVVVNVGIFCRGVDMPYLGCVIMARPTRSYNLYIQQAGRGTRPFPGKKDFLILDHASNIIRHGFIHEEPEVNLDGKKMVPRIMQVRICKVCFMAFQGINCPECGPLEVNTIREIQVVEGELHEIKMRDPVLEFIRVNKIIATQRGYKIGWVYRQLIAKFGIETAYPHLPSWWLNVQQR